jgi:hypothetical protein
VSDLTLTEMKHVRTALRYLRRRAGAWAVVAQALHCATETAKKATNGHDNVSARLAFKVARLAGVPMDDLLEGRYLPGACPNCGHMPDFADENTVVETAPRPDPSGLKLVR